MSYVENDKYEKIKRIIYEYLCEYNLPKIACLSTPAPTKYDKDYLYEYFSYICYCSSSLMQYTNFLLKRYLLRVGRTPFNVVISTPLACLQARRYGYVHIATNEQRFARDFLTSASDLKSSLSKEFSILIRIDGVECESSKYLPQNCLIVENLDNQDSVYKIDLPPVVIPVLK